MAVNDTSGSVTICSRGRSSVFADDLGVTVRGLGRARRFAWSDISHFADGIKSAEHGYLWVLDIVLRTGRTRRVQCTRAPSAAPQTLAAVRLVADRYGIPADLAGVPMKNGRPPIHGVYQDPGGQAGLRYWDGSRWSPLLPPGAVTGWFTVWTNTTARWTELPVANEPWDYPATRAARSKAWIRVSGVLIAALLAAGLAAGLGLMPGSWDAAGFFCLLAIIPAGILIFAWLNWRQWTNMATAANASSTQRTSRG